MMKIAVLIPAEPTAPECLAQRSAESIGCPTNDAGAGEPLFAGVDLPRLGYHSIRCTPGEKAVHYVIARG